VIITSAEDAKKIKAGDVFFIEPPGFDDPEHDVEAFADAYAKLGKEVEEVLKESLKPVDPNAPKVTVERSGADAVMVYVHDQEMLPAVVDGDARKTTMKSTPKEVKLQKSRKGTITVAGEEVAYPDA